MHHHSHSHSHSPHSPHSFSHSNSQLPSRYPPPTVHGYPPKIPVDPAGTVHMPWLPPTNIPPPPLPPSDPSGADLFRAVENGDLTLVHYFISKMGVTPKFADPSGNTTLHVAARTGYTQISNYLIEQGLDPNVTNEKGHTPVMWAVTKGHLAAVTSLVKRGADPSVTDAKGYNAVIHAAITGHIFILHYLLKSSNIDPNVVDNEGRSALSWAATNGHLQVVEYMLSSHCPTPVHIGKIDQAGRTAMHWAAHGKHQEIVELLVKARCRACSEGEEQCGAKIGEEMLVMTDIEGQTPAECARAKGHHELAKKISTGIWGKKKPPKYEPLLQYLSSFLPHFMLFFVVIPDYPFWAAIIFAIAIIWIHANIRWSVPEKTLVPAGLMTSGILLLTYIYSQSLPFYGFLIAASGLAYGALTFYRLMTEDPGFIMPNDNDYEAALAASEFGMEPQEFCKICKVRKPPRAKHCRTCGLCSNRFDHHCFWIYNCVAEKNIRRFYFFLIQVLVNVGIFEIVTFYSIYETSLLETVVNAFFLHAQKAWTLCFCVLVFIPVLSLCSYHTNFISRDTTTYEVMRPRGIKPQRPSAKRIIAFLMHGSSVFDKGEGDESMYV